MWSSAKIIVIAILLACVVSMPACSSVSRTSSGTRGQSTTSSSVTMPVIPRGFIAFAKALKLYEGLAWYPTYLPSGFSLESLETTTLAEGQGPVCDVVFARRETRIYLSQGSSVARDYQIVPIESVRWGTDIADTMAAETNDPNKIFIVYLGQQNLGELSGDVSNQELKKIAASMRPVP